MYFFQCVSPDLQSVKNKPVILFATMNTNGRIPNTPIINLCDELCGSDLTNKILCHTKHLSKARVFTLQQEDQQLNSHQPRLVVVKSIKKLEFSSLPVDIEDANVDDVCKLYLKF